MARAASGRTIVVDYQVDRHWATEDRPRAGSALLSVLVAAVSVGLFLTAGYADVGLPLRSAAASRHEPGMAAAPGPPRRPGPAPRTFPEPTRQTHAAATLPEARR